MGGKREIMPEREMVVMGMEMQGWGEGRSVGDREEIWEEEGRRSWRGNGWMAWQLRGGLPEGE